MVIKPRVGMVVRSRDSSEWFVITRITKEMWWMKWENELIGVWQMDQPFDGNWIIDDLSIILQTLEKYGEG
jgi:hypothetical protein